MSAFNIMLLVLIILACIVIQVMKSEPDKPPTAGNGNGESHHRRCTGSVKDGNAKAGGVIPANISEAELRADKYRPIPRFGETWLHHKGNLYFTYGVFTDVTNESDGERYVGYSRNGRLYFRNFSEFMGRVPDGRYRFQRWEKTKSKKD